MNDSPAAVIFDMDGLLFDSEALYRDAFIETATNLGHALSVSHFLQLVGRPWALNRMTLQEQIGSSHDPDEFQAVWMQSYDRIKGRIELKPGVAELLDWLRQARIPHAICTSSSHDHVQHNLTVHGLDAYFDAVVAAGDYARGKPHPDPYMRAAEILGLSPATCLALEDSHNGVRSAAAAGMQTVMVPDLLKVTAEISALCIFVAKDLHEVKAYLTRLTMS